MSLRCAYIDHGKGGPPDILRLAERNGSPRRQVC